VEDPDAPFAGHGDGGAGLGHRVHGGAEQRHRQGELPGQPGADVDLVREHLAVRGHQAARRRRSGTREASLPAWHPDFYWVHPRTSGGPLRAGALRKVMKMTLGRRFGSSLGVLLFTACGLVVLGPGCGAETDTAIDEQDVVPDGAQTPLGSGRALHREHPAAHHGAPARAVGRRRPLAVRRPPGRRWRRRPRPGVLRVLRRLGRQARRQLRRRRPVRPALVLLHVGLHGRDRGHRPRWVPRPGAVDLREPRRVGRRGSRAHEGSVQLARRRDDARRRRHERRDLAERPAAGGLLPRQRRPREQGQRREAQGGVPRREAHELHRVEEGAAARRQDPEVDRRQLRHLQGHRRLHVRRSPRARRRGLAHERPAHRAGRRPRRTTSAAAPTRRCQTRSRASSKEPGAARTPCRPAAAA
jgi:hypothetical protein